MSARSAVMALVLAGCASGPRITTSMPALERGRCGGLAGALDPEPVSLLGDRMRMHVPARTNARRASIDDVLFATSAGEERRELEHEGARISLRVQELFRRPGADLATAVARSLDRPATIVRDGDSRVMVVFDELSAEGDDVALLDAYATTSDGLVVEIAFHANANAARDGGCQALAVELARTLAPGERTLPIEPGEHELAPGIAIRLPPDHVISLEEHGDHFTYFVSGLPEIGAPSQYLLLSFDFAAQQAPLTVPSRTVTAPTFGRPRRWREWRTPDGARWRDTLVSDRGSVIVAFSARDDEVFETLAATAASVEPRRIARRPLTCAGPASPAAASLTPDEALSTLLRAARFTSAMPPAGSPRAPELEAFARVIARSTRTAELRYLVAHGTTAGRLFGLAGLYFADRSGFDAALCAARGAVEERVTVLTACGEEERAVAPLLESRDPGAIRGEYFWAPNQWLEPGAADLRGGALAYLVYRAATVDPAGAPAESCAHPP